MSKTNREVLEEGNSYIVAGNNEAFLALCTEDIVWTTVGESKLNGKSAVREWMKEAYVEPPEFTVKHVVAEGNYVVALGNINSKDKDGKSTQNAYSDVWRFRDGKMAELNAFVVKTEDG